MSQKKIEKACFQHNMAYEDCKDLPGTITQKMMDKKNAHANY